MSFLLVEELIYLYVEELIYNDVAHTWERDILHITRSQERLFRFSRTIDVRLLGNLRNTYIQILVRNQYSDSCKQ
jgi:hypothetical protein